MTLDISIKGCPASAHVVFDADDPIYWFLYPYFESVWNETGEMIDLYGTAEFYAEQLLALFLVLEKAADEARSRTEPWMVTIGYQTDGRTPITKPVTRADVLACIGSLQQMANDSYNDGQVLVCFGD
jgi:hypothetical protein